MLPLAVGALAISYFAYQRKKRFDAQKLLPVSMNFSDLNSEQGVAKFREVMSEKGYIVFHLDEAVAKSITSYRSSCEEFFRLSDVEKLRLSGIDGSEMKKRNDGYLVVDGSKEFLKLKPKNPEYFPSHSETFRSSFTKCYESFYNMFAKTFSIIANDVNEKGQKYISDELENIILNRMKESASISVINYFPVEKPLVTTKELEDFSIPSEIHQDTGVMTFIMCSDVVGLQVRARGSEEWVTVERLAQAGTDMFCILGKKIEMFATDPRALKYEATWHRVILPYNVQRYSTLYFIP